jgi:hypothetical protein
MGKNEINLDGGEISILKALGLGGSEITGEELMEKVPDLMEAELIDSIKGLIMMGYVVADRRSFYDEEGLKLTKFCVNSGYAKDLKAAMDPRTGREAKSKRVRRE